MSAVAFEQAVRTAFSWRLDVIVMPALLTYFWSIALGFATPLAYMAMISFNTAAQYVTNMVTDVEEDTLNNPDQDRRARAGSGKVHAAIWVCFAGSALIAVLASGWHMLLYGMALNVLGRLYGAPIPLPSGRHVRIKSILIVKNTYSSLFWSAALLLSPYVFLLQQPGPGVLWAMPAAFLLAFFVELLWDVRDVAGDRAAGVTTIPVQWGLGATRLILHALNIGAALIIVAGIILKVFPFALVVIIPHAAATALYTDWYMRLADHRLASHGYLILAALSAAGAIILHVASLGPA